MTQYNSTTHPTISASSNLLAYPTFDAGTLAGDNWTASATGTGTTPAAAVPPTAPPTGTNGLKFIVAVGTGTSQAYVKFPIKPGQQVQGEFYWLIPTTSGTGYTLTTQIDWLDAGGNVISTPYSYGRTALQTTWQKDNVSPSVVAPQGAAFFRLIHTLSGTIATATVNAYTGSYNMTVF